MCSGEDPPSADNLAGPCGIGSPASSTSGCGAFPSCWHGSGTSLLDHKAKVKVTEQETSVQGELCQNTKLCRPQTSIGQGHLPWWICSVLGLGLRVISVRVSAAKHVCIDHDKLWTHLSVISAMEALVGGYVTYIVHAKSKYCHYVQSEESSLSFHQL